MRECTDAYEIGYEPNSLGMCDWDNPVVVVFHSVKFQIMRHNLIPAELADDFSLPVLTLLEDVITYLKANEVTDCNHEATHQKVRAFLMKEKFVVSWKDVALILQKLRRH